MCSSMPQVNLILVSGNLKKSMLFPISLMLFCYFVPLALLFSSSSDLHSQMEV